MQSCKELIEKDGLKICPFCGGVPEYEEVNAKKNYVKIVCQNCGCQTGIFIDGSDGEKKATDAWNKRVSEIKDFDYGLSDFYLSVIKAINEKLALDIETHAINDIERIGRITSWNVRQNIGYYEMPIKTQQAYERIIFERESERNQARAQLSRFKNLYDKEKHSLSSLKKVAFNNTDFTKLRNAKDAITALYDIFSERFKELEEQES